MSRTEKPMTKTEVRSWLKRTREACRDAEAALQRGTAEDLLEAAQEIGACGAEIEGALTSDFDDPRGVVGMKPIENGPATDGWTGQGVYLGPTADAEEPR